MVRSTLAVAVILMYSTAMLAQHSSAGGGGSSGGGGGHSSGGSSGGGSSGGSSSSPSISHSSGGSSGGSSAHGSSGGGSGGSSAHGSWVISSKGIVSGVDKQSNQQVKAMVKSGKSTEEIREFLRSRGEWRPATLEHPEKRGFFSFLRHPFRRPEVADLRHRICVSGTCRVCPAGSTMGKNGACSATGASPNMCMAGTYWSEGGCTILAARYRNCTYPTDVDLIAARREMELAQKRMQAACSHDPASHECSSLNVAYQRAVGSYNFRRNMHQRLFDQCVEGP